MPLCPRLYLYPLPTHPLVVPLCLQVAVLFLMDLTPDDAAYRSLKEDEEREVELAHDDSSLSPMPHTSQGHHSQAASKSDKELSPSTGVYTHVGMEP